MKDEDKDISIDKDADLDDSVIAEEHQGDALKKLKLKLKEAEAKAKEYLDGWQRTQADFVNLRKRDEEAKLDFVKFANSTLVEDLLPVLDSFTLALQKFNPNLHESIGSLPAEKKEDDHKILEVIQKGYIMHGKIIRPARVKIGEYKQ